jgi:putative DNA primase/helicase
MSIFPVNVSSIPQKMREGANWVGWVEQPRNGTDQITKPPINPQTGHFAKPNDPTTWGTLAEAQTAVEQFSLTGIGYALTRGAGIVAVDLDDCRNPETGDLDPMAERIVKRFDSYTEVSPSGNGLHIFVAGTLPQGKRRNGNIEMYDSDRYITVTGERLPIASSNVEDRQGAIEDLHAWINGDATLVETAKQDDPQFLALWEGDASAYKGDESGADLALCNMLAARCNKNAQRIDRIFRWSGLMRPKWDEPHFQGGETYGERTVAKACEVVPQDQQATRNGLLQAQPPTGRRSMEQTAAILAQQVIAYVRERKGLYLRDENDALYVVVDGKRIPLEFTPSNRAISGLLLAACGTSTVGGAARSAIQRLQVHADGEAGRYEFRRFSAVSKDGKRVYIPVSSGKLLQITGDDITEVPNGDNIDHFWLEHPNGTPLDYRPIDVKAALEDFERLVVNTQACETDAMRWLVAIAEGFFPLVRDVCPARLIFVHCGPSQNGKTSGAQRFTLLHGLGQVKASYTTAALRNMGDCGLLVLDNKEHANLTQDLIDYLLVVSTGGEDGRSLTDGTVRTHGRYRPVVVVTSIEGLFKAELRNRSVEVSYEVPGGGNLGRAGFEREIMEKRNSIGASMVPVIQRYLGNPSKPNPNPIPAFEEHFSELCAILRAYGEVTQKPEGWAAAIIAAWDVQFRKRDAEEDELEQPLLEVLESSQFRTVPLTHKGKAGTLYVVSAGQLLAPLARQVGTFRAAALPRTAQALSRRLHSCRFAVLTVLDDKAAPEVPELKRSSHKRPIGLWVPADDLAREKAA